MIVAFVSTFISHIPNSYGVQTNSLEWGEQQGEIRQSPDHPIHVHEWHIAEKITYVPKHQSILAGGQIGMGWGWEQ
jgi:hypothetical protein